MLLFLAVTDLIELLFQGFKGLVSAFMAWDIAASITEVFQLLCKSWGF